MAAGGWYTKIHIQLAALPLKGTIQTLRQRFRYNLSLEISPPYQIRSNQKFAVTSKLGGQP
jgi:hypothetical protein